MITEERIAEGIEELKLAYEILPHPNVLYNIGRAYVLGERYEEALDFFEQYLATDPPDREDVESLMASIGGRETRDQPPPSDAEELVEVAAPVDSEDLAQTSVELLSLADAVHDPVIAQRLRDVAERMRETASERVVAAGPSDPSHDEERERVSRPAELVAENRDDVYEEQVFSASRVAESPLDAPNSTTAITAQDIRLSGALNVAAPLRRAAGVAYLQTGPGDPQISIRGLNQRLSNRVVTLLDGRSVYLDFLGATFYQYLPIGLLNIDRVEIIRGPASALYGADAMTGVINIISHPLGQGRNYAFVGAGTDNQRVAAVSVDARSDALRGRVMAGYQSVDQYALEVGPDRVDVRAAGRAPNEALLSFYMSGELEYRSGGYSIRGGLSTSNDDLTVSGTGRLRALRVEDAFDSQAYLQFQTPWGLWTRVFWNRVSNDIYSASLIEGGIDEAQHSELARADVIDAETVYRTEFDLGGFANRFIGGVSYRFKEAEWTWLDDTRTQHHGALFLQDSLRFDDVAQLAVSLRGDLHPLVGPQFSPHGSLIIHPSEGQTIRVTGGAAFRGPTFTESYVDVTVPTPLRAVSARGRGNTNLDPERLISAEIGYMNQMTEFMSVEVAAYFNVVLDLITLDRVFPNRLYDFARANPSAGYQVSSESFPLSTTSFDNIDQELKQLGAEVSLRLYPIDGLDIYANYSIHETSPLSGSPGPYASDRRTSAHVVNAGVQYRAPFGLDVSTDLSWNSDQRWVEQELDPVMGLHYRVFPLRAYTVLNARLGYRLLGDQLEVAVVGTNLVDAGHREHPFGQPIDRRFYGTLTVWY